MTFVFLCATTLRPKTGKKIRRKYKNENSTLAKKYLSGFNSFYNNAEIIIRKEKYELRFCFGVRIIPLWRRLRDSNPRGFCPNGFQDRLVMTASISLRLFGFFLRLFASLQCLCFRIFCGEKVVVVCYRATFTFARLSKYILFFRKNQLFFSENYCFPNFSVFRLFLSLVCVKI